MMDAEPLRSDEAENLSPQWCLIGNILPESRHGEDGDEIRKGTKHFAPGAKVYCLPTQWGDGYENIVVVGRHRGTRGRQLATMVIRSDRVTKWRSKVVYEPAVLKALKAATDEPWKPNWSSREQVEEYVAMMRNRETKGD